MNFRLMLAGFMLFLVVALSGCAYYGSYGYSDYDDDYYSGYPYRGYPSYHYGNSFNYGNPFGYHRDRDAK